MKVRLTTTYGDIVLALDPERAPKTVENFVQYVRDGFYDGTVFHRVIDGFMVQGGGFEPGMRQKPTRPAIENEAGNGLGNVTGAVAMARTADPHSASAQFFINCNENDYLDREKAQDGWGYCVFGMVVEGSDVVTRIEESDTTTRSGQRDVPVEDIVIERAELLDA